MFCKPLKIGNIELKNNIILAPMAGITDLPFRILCKEQGVGLTVTEMVSSKALFYHDEKTKKLLNREGEIGPVSVQLFGSDIEAMVEATKYVNEIADIIDINMGCPAPKIIKNGDGSKLLLNLELVEKIVENVVKVANKPVTVKIRKGWDTNHIVATQAAQIIEKAGASAITIHGRTRAEFYSGIADLESIKKVKEAVSIPVIGNGDITDEESAKHMLEYTGVDGIMIGRASLGNPWIFREVIHYLKTGQKLAKPTLEEKWEVIQKHVTMEVKEKGEYTAIREMRKQISWYTKGLKDSSKIREQISRMDTKQDMLQMIEQYFKEIK